MSEGQRFANLPSALAMTAAAAALESAVAYRWLGGGMPAWAALAAHAAIACGLAIWSGCSSAAREDIRLPMLLAVSTAALGPIGAFGSLLTIVLSKRYLRQARPFDEWYRSLCPDANEAGDSKLADQIREADPGGAEPVTAFSDILAFGSVPQKQDLIALISRYFRPAFGPVLKQALNDRESVIRVQAATAMSKLENTILDRTLALRRTAREHPEDPEALRALAGHYDECLFCGILDPKREEELLDEALAVYRECLAADPNDSATCLAAGRLLLRSRRFHEAAQFFELAGDPGSARPPAALWYMESLFHLRKFGEIRRIVRDWRSGEESSAVYPPEALEAVRLWTAPVSPSGGREER